MRLIILVVVTIYFSSVIQLRLRLKMRKLKYRWYSLWCMVKFMSTAIVTGIIHSFWWSVCSKVYISCYACELKIHCPNNIRVLRDYFLRNYIFYFHHLHAGYRCDQHIDSNIGNLALTPPFVTTPHFPPSRVKEISFSHILLSFCSRFFVTFW